MTPFHISHEFTGSQERFWQAYFHRDYLPALREVTGMGPAEELELEVTDERVVRRVRRQPRRQIPAFVRKVTGANLVFEEHEELDRTTCRMACQIYRDGSDEPIMLGDYSTAPAADGRFRRVFAGSIDVRIVAAGQDTDLGAAHRLGDLANRLEVARRGDRESRLDHVHPQIHQRLGDLELFGQVHAGAGRLLAVAERGVEDRDRSWSGHRGLRGLEWVSVGYEKTPGP